ncbi:MAG: F0F1 ATP synthase subunit B [Coriobacteriia bacterium]|nr:F0F1 ATP synthase subunit B [Coriobacteriia bacterium]
MKIRFALPFVAALMTPALAFAADSYGSDEPASALDTVLTSPIMPKLGDFIPMILAVGVLVFVLGKFVWPPIMKALDEREEKIEGSLKSAEEAKIEAEEILAQYEAKLDEGRREAAVLVEEGRKAGDTARDEIVARAQAEAAAITSKAQADADAKEKAVAAALQKQTASLAVSIASKILGEKLGAEDQARAEELAKIGG